MNLLVFVFHNLVSTPIAGLERVAVEGGSALRNIANNYVKEGEGSSNTKDQGVTENGHHAKRKKILIVACYCDMLQFMKVARVFVKITMLKVF